MQVSRLLLHLFHSALSLPTDGSQALMDLSERVARIPSRELNSESHIFLKIFVLQYASFLTNNLHKVKPLRNIKATSPNVFVFHQSLMLKLIINTEAVNRHRYSLLPYEYRTYSQIAALRSIVKDGFRSVSINNTFIQPMLQLLPNNKFIVGL